MLQDEQFSIDREIGIALLSTIDSVCSELYLEVEKINGNQRIHIQNKSTGETIFPSDDLMVAIRKLFILHNKYQTNLRCIKYTYTKQDGTKWHFISDYTYYDE
jgi:hypothetical protein